MSLRPLPPFALERFFARWEFAVEHVLCASDVETLKLDELLALCDDEVLDQWKALGLGYTESLGLPALRRQIAAMYPGLDVDDVVTFSGAEEGIFLTVQACLSAGDHAVVVWPAYQALYQVARAAGADVSLVPLEPGDWSLDVDALIAALRPTTRLVVINFPHNPTGASITAEDLHRLVAAAGDCGARILSDEVYRQLELSAPMLPPAASLGAHAASLGVLSKSYGLAGLRIGWIATRDSALRERVVQLRDYTTICNAAPSEVLALGALRAAPAILQRNVGIVRENLERLRDFFGRHTERFQWIEPRAGSVCFPRLREGDADAFADALVREQGVLVMPGSRFEYDSSYFRVGLGRRDMPQALARLDSFLEGHPG